MTNFEQVLCGSRELRLLQGKCFMGAAALMAVAAFLYAGHALSQSDSVSNLIERSAIVVSGTVARVNASLEPLQKASPQTIVIKVSRIYAGAEIAGDQAGRMVTVILRRPAESHMVGTEVLFFGNPRFAGKSLTIAEEGEVLGDAVGAAIKDLENALQARRERPLRERLAAASSIFRGMVESERELDEGPEEKDESRELESEHDPEWHVASVRVVTAISGVENGAIINVIFPASRDIMWFKAPKLKAGQEAIFVTHKTRKDDERLMRARGVVEFLERESAVLVSEPLDALPVSDEGRVRNLLAKGR
jgi:hypothetical protein